MADHPNNGVVMNRVSGAVSEFPADVRIEGGRLGTAVADAVDYLALVREGFVRVSLQNSQHVAGRDTAVGDFAL